MKKLLIILGFILLIITRGLYAKKKYIDPHERLEIAKSEAKTYEENDQIKDGDIIFQTSLSAQSKAIQLATHSKYSHCGIIFKDKNGFYVLEAVQPVKHTTMDKWLSKGADGHYVIKRLKNADSVLTLETITKMKKIGDVFSGKDYDLT